MNSSILASAREISRLGGKAAQLQWLKINELNVPDFIVLGYDRLRSRFNSSAKKLNLTNIDRSEIFSWVSEQRRLGHKQFIVRSSLSSEDSALNSYAGQLESYGNLTNESEIIDYIELCYLSAFSARVDEYRRARADMTDLQMSVIVQVMIHAETSGVLFTADPTDGNRDRMLISAAAGACHHVVSGLGDCDEYAVKTSTNAVTALKNEFNILNENQVLSLVEKAKDIATRAKEHRDVEWVFANNQFYFVQSRPITSLGPDRSTHYETVFDNSNIQESFNGLTLPLTFSHAVEAYRRVYSQLMRSVGFSEAEIGQHDRRHQQMLGLIHGRVYYNINNWYAGLLLLPSFGRNKADMEQMMGLESPVDFVVDENLSPLQKVLRLPKFLKMLGRMMIAFAQIDRRFNDFNSKFQALYKSFDESRLHWKSAQEIFGEFIKLRDQMFDIWSTPVLNDFYVMMASGRVTRRLDRVGLADHASSLLAGEDLESLLPTKKLIEIAEMIRSCSTLAKYLSAEDFSAFTEALSSEPAYAEVNLALSRFIESYGDRVAGELKLETVTFRQDREVLYQILKNYVSDANVTVSEFEHRQNGARAKAEKTVFEAIRSKLGASQLRAFRRDLKNFRKGVRYRESMRLDRTRSFGVARASFILIGSKLHEMGWLNHPRDVFYLTVDEIDGFLFAKSFFDDPKNLVETRKAQYEKWAFEKLPGQIHADLPLRPEDLIATTSSIRSAEDLTASPSVALKGIGCFTGEVTAEVVVLNEPRFDLDLKGKILVAERTDPGWTPLFAQISGLIVEKGSTLSHSAVIARELALPTIVAVKNVTRLIRTGQRVALNGHTGEVRIIM